MASCCRLGSLLRITPIAEGSVNSNYFIDTEKGRFFLRIYEEQGKDGVRYERALLGHLGRAIPVPRPIVHDGDEILEVLGKPVGVFEVVLGDPICQAGVTDDHAGEVGRMLGTIHAAGTTFASRRSSRFGVDDVRDRLKSIAAPSRAIEDARHEIGRAIDDAVRALPCGATGGVIHGDLFRDNVRWDGTSIVAVIDWESASDGLYAYDLMVTMLAWCFGSEMDWDLSRKMVAGYHAVRPLAPVDVAALWPAALLAAARFTTTRITDYALREAKGPRVMKDYRRFLERLRVIRGLSPADFTGRLTR